MSMSRRAIIHIGGKRREQIPQRLLKTKQSLLFDKTPDDNFYFTIDLDKEENTTYLRDEEIDYLLDQPRPKDLRKVKKFNIQIATENEHKLIQKNLDEKQKSEILKRVKQVKQTIKKKKQDSDTRKNMKLSQILIDCEMDIEYYKDIEAKFLQFEKKFYIQTKDPKHKYNPFKFSLNTEYNAPLEYTNDVESIGSTLIKWEELNNKNTKEPKYNLATEFVQIMKDAPRNVITYQNDNNNLSFGQDPHNSAFFFYFSQLSVFIQYFYFEYDKKNTKNFCNRLSNAAYKDAEFYNNYIIEQYIKNGNINEGAFQTYVAQHTKDGVERKDIGSGLYSQTDLQGFLGILLATSSPDDKKYNIIDAAALYTYIYKKQGIHTFFNNIFSSIDIKDGHKHTLKIMTIFDLVDPDLFSELFDNITKQAEEEGDKQFWYKRLGETYIKNTTTFDNEKKSPWLISEKHKYDIFHDSSKKTLAEVIDDIKKEPKDNLNKPHEALIESYDKTPDDITKIITITTNDPFVSPKHSFSNGDTKLEMIHSFIKPLIMEIWSYVIWSLHTKNDNYHFHALNSYYKYLYKYGITGWILFMAIHLKNMKTSIHLSNDTKEIYNFKKTVDKIKDETVNAPFIAEFLIPTEQYPTGYPNIAKGKFGFDFLYALSFTEQASPFFMKKKKIGHEFDFQHNAHLNPLTTNIKDTYNKHFDFCIDHLNNIHGSIATFETEFDKLYNRSLILYKNGYMKENRLSEIKNTHKGITIVDKITDIWNKHKNDNRIHFKKSKEHSGELLKGMDKGWLGNVKTDLLRNALDGVYHVCYNTFMKDVSKIMKPFVSSSKGKGKCPNIPSLWPRNSGRPFIFVNKLHGEGGRRNINLKRTSFFDEKQIKKKLLTGVISTGCLPNYWFNTKNMFTEEDIAKNKLLVEFDNMKPQNGIGGIIEWNTVEDNLRSHLLSRPMPPARADSTSSDDSDDSYDPIEETSREPPTVERKDSNEPIIGDRPEDLGPEMQEHSDQQAIEEANRLAQERLADGKKVGADIDELTYTIDELRAQQQKLLDAISQDPERRGQLAQKDDSGDDSGDDEDPIPAPQRSPKTRVEQIQERFSLEVDKVPEDGDCLFEVFRRTLAKHDATKNITVQDIREKIVEHITEIVEDNRGNQTGPWRETYEDIILATKNEDTGERLYENREDYKVKMKKILTGTPRAQFGDHMEINAFEELEWGEQKFTVQVLKWDNGRFLFMRPSNELKFKENQGKHNVINTLNSGLHYDALNLIGSPESAGSVEQPISPKVSQQDQGSFERAGKRVKLKNEIEENEKKLGEWLAKAAAHKKKAVTLKKERKQEQAIHYLKMAKVYEKNIEEGKKKGRILNNRLKKLQQGGSNNVYINKCKNHRHNKTKKYRMKLKDIDSWVYLEPGKKKKFTRKKF